MVLPRQSQIHHLAQAIDFGGDLAELERALRMTRLARLSAAALEDVAAAAGVTTAEAVVLAALAATGPPHRLAPSTLNGIVVQSPAGITKTLRRLEAAQLVKRLPDPGDRRALHVELTGEGLARAGDATAAVVRHHAQLTQGVDATDLEAFARVLAHVLGRLEELRGLGSSETLHLDPSP